MQEVLALKKIRIGYEEYKEFINKDMYYVDKTILMRHIVECGGKDRCQVYL